MNIIDKLLRWSRMEEAGIRPDGVSYRSMMNACAKAGLSFSIRFGHPQAPLSL